MSLLLRHLYKNINFLEVLCQQDKFSTDLHGRSECNYTTSLLVFQCISLLILQNSKHKITTVSCNLIEFISILLIFNKCIKERSWRGRKGPRENEKGAAFLTALKTIHIEELSVLIFFFHRC